MPIRGGVHRSVYHNKRIQILHGSEEALYLNLLKIIVGVFLRERALQTGLGAY